MNKNFMNFNMLFMILLLAICSLIVCCDKKDKENKKIRQQKNVEQSMIDGNNENDSKYIEDQDIIIENIEDGVLDVEKNIEGDLVKIVFYDNSNENDISMQYRLLLNNDKDEDVSPEIYKEADIKIYSINSIKMLKDNEYVFYVDPSLLFDKFSLQVCSDEINSNIARINNGQHNAPSDINNYIIAHQTMKKGYLLEKYEDDKTGHSHGKTTLSHINNLEKRTVEFFSRDAFNPGGWEPLKPEFINDSILSLKYGIGDMGGFEAWYINYSLDDMLVIKKYVFTPQLAEITEKNKSFELKVICDKEGNVEDVRLNNKSLDFVPLPLENFDVSSLGNCIEFSHSEDYKNIEIYVYGKDKSGTIIDEKWLLSIEDLPEIKLTKSVKN